MYNHVKARFDSMPNVLKGKLNNRVMVSLLAPYQCKVIFNNEVGKFGFGTLDFFKNIHSFGDNAGSAFAFEVGNYSEITADALIMLGGEHRNNDVLNTTFGSFSDLLETARQAKLIPPREQWRFSQSRGPVVIGANVTISKNVTILSGVKIGNGAVIGAGSVVTRDIPPFAIAAGNPAKVIRYRFNEDVINMLQQVRWWDMPIKFVLENIPLINSLVLQPEALSKLQLLGEHLYMKKNDNYMIFSCGRDSGFPEIKFLGAEVAGQTIELAKLPDEFKFFISQLDMQPGGDFYMIKDIFKLSGLSN